MKQQSDRMGAIIPEKQRFIDDFIGTVGIGCYAIAFGLSAVWIVCYAAGFCTVDARASASENSDASNGGTR